MSRILFIEDDPWLGPSVTDFLREEGFDVFLLLNVTEFLPIRFQNFDLLLLDLILPGLSGEEILRRVKETVPNFPVLILTAKSCLESKKKCFELGADDYLVKPFEVLELSLRIKALLRRTKVSEISVSIGDVFIDLKKGIVRKGNRTIKLSRRAWDLLSYFVTNRGKVLSKAEILSNVWRDAQVTEESVRSYVKELRKILPPGSIETIKGRGYVLRER